MKLLIAYILAVTSLFADPVYFSWRPNIEQDLAGYTLYTGPAIGMPVQGFQTTGTRAGIDMLPGHVAWLVARNTAGMESLPAGPLEYRAVDVRLVIQQTKDLVQWGGEAGVFDFRLPDVIAGSVVHRLRMTQTRIEAHVYGRVFSVPVPIGVGKKFFRSYVAPLP